MINKEKLREFLDKENKKFCEIMSKNHSHGQFCYEQGYADATAEVIIKLNSGEFDVKEKEEKLTNRDKLNKICGGLSVSNVSLAEVLIETEDKGHSYTFDKFGENSETYDNRHKALAACIKWLESEVKQ